MYIDNHKRELAVWAWRTNGGGWWCVYEASWVFWHRVGEIGNDSETGG